MPFSATALQQAREAGWQDADITAHLVQQDPRIKTAVDAGYTLDEIGSFLGQSSPQKGAFTETTSERVQSGIAQAAARAVAGIAKTVEDAGPGTPMGLVSEGFRMATGVSPLTEAAKFAGEVAEEAPKAYGLDPSQDQKTSSKIISAASNIVPIIASGPAAPLTAAAIMGESGREEAEKAGSTEAQQNTSFYANAGVGLVTEALLGLPAIVAFANKTKLPEAGFRAIVGHVAKQAARGVVRGATENAVQQAASNVIASTVAQYEKDRPILQGVGEAALIGGGLGGAVSGVVGGASLPERYRVAREQIKGVSTDSLKVALTDEDLIQGSEFTKSLIEQEIQARDPGYKAEEAGAPLTADALRTIPEPTTQPTEGGDKTSESQAVLSNPEGSVQDRNEQRQGQRPGDERAGQGLRPDGGDTAANRGSDQERSPVDAGVRPQAEVIPSTQTEPAPEPASKGAEPPAEGPLTKAEQNELAELVAVGGKGQEAKARREELWSRSDKYGTEQTPKRAEQSKLDAVLSMLPQKARASTETPGEARQPSKREIVLQKQIDELEGDLSEAKVSGNKGAVRGLREELKAKKAELTKETAKAAQPPQTTESTAPVESAPSPEAKAGEPSSTKSDTDPVAIEAKINKLLKQHKSADTETQRKIWIEVRKLEDDLRAASGDSEQPLYAGIPNPFKAKPIVPTLGKPPSGGNFLRVPKALARASTGRLFVDGSADTLARIDNPVAQDLSKAIKEHVDSEQVYFAKAQSSVDDALRGMPKKAQERAFTELETYLRNRENKRPTATLSPNAQKILDAWEDVAEWTGKEAQRLGIKVFDPATGGYRPINLIGRKYLPRKFTPEVERVFRDDQSNPALWDSLVLALSAHKGISTDAAAAEMRSTAARFVDNDFMGNVEMARSEALPEVFYDYDLSNIMSSYIPAFAERAAQVKAYGQRLGTGQQMVQPNLFDKARAEAPDQYSKNWLNEVENQATNFRLPNSISAFMRGAQTVANALLLSSPTTTVLRNMISGTGATAEFFGGTRGAKGLIDAASPQAFRDAREIGTIRDNLADTLNADQLGDSPVDNAIKDATAFMLKYSGYNGSELFVRTHGTQVASQFAMDGAAAIAKNPNSALAKEAQAVFRRMDVDPAKIVAENGYWRNGEETARFIRNSVRELQGGYRFDQVPLWANSPAGRFFYQYGRYGVQRSRSLFRNIAQPFLGTEINVGGKTMRQYRVAPLLRTAAGIALTGEAFALIASALFGRDRRDASLKEISEAWSEDKKVGAALAFQRVINDLITAGTLGILGQPIDAVRSLKDQSRLKNPFAPPGLSSTNAVLQLAANAYDQGGTVTRRDLQTFMGGMAPGVKQLSDVARNVMDEPLYEAEQDVATLRAAANRWAKRQGLDVSPKGGGKDDLRRKGPNSPVFEPIEDALRVGNVDKARILARAWIASHETPKEQKAALDTLRKSVRGRVPFRAGPYSGKEYVQGFYEWAQKNLPKDQLDRASRIQERYVRSAKKAGLME